MCVDAHVRDAVSLKAFEAPSSTHEMMWSAYDVAVRVDDAVYGRLARLLEQCGLHDAALDRAHGHIDHHVASRRLDQYRIGLMRGTEEVRRRK